MASRRPGRQLKYQRIADELKAAIESGEYGPGDRIPGENDLMERHKVARMTARQALGVLRSEGLIETRMGAGVFVRDFRPIRRRSAERLSERIWGAGRSVWAAETEGRELVVDVVSVAEEVAPEGIAQVLGLAEGATACVRRRRFVLDGRPVMVATSYLDAALVAGTAITHKDTGPGGIYARLDEMGHKPVSFREEIHRSRPPTAADREYLRLAQDAAVILIRRTARTAEGRAVEVNDMILDASAYILEYDIDA
jgi:GntR family transcriptional regulator